MIKKGIYTAIGCPLSLEERLALIRKTGFDYVCLDFEQNHQPREGKWEDQLRLAQKYRLPVHAVHLTGQGMNSVWSDGEDGERVTARLIEELRRLKALGLSLGVAHVTWGINPPEAPSETALGRFEKIAEAAEHFGVCVALENSAFAEPIRSILDRIQSPFVGFCYDSGHQHAFTPQEDYLSRYGNRLMEMHLHDNDGLKDQHLLPMKGSIDWGGTMKKIRKTEFGNTMLTLEAVCQPERDPKGFLEDSYQTAITLIKFKEE